jgi:predicted DNA-binding transcriptional regulator AlpA
MNQNSSQCPDPLMIRRAQLKSVVGLSPSTVDRLERAGDFPTRRRFGPGVVGWLTHEVKAWMGGRKKAEIGKSKS